MKSHTDRNDKSEDDPMYDVIIIGGGPAGLQAALTLGRLHRTTLLLDSGRYRNDPAAEMHNFVTHDGTPPAEFRRAARRDLDGYDTVEVVGEEVASVEPDDGAFVVRTTAGTAYDGARVILATGVRDTLPDIPGIEQLWGTVVAHCPFCHGHEFSGGTVAVLGGPHAPRLAGMLSRIAAEVLVLVHDHALTEDERAQLDRLGARVVAGRVGSISRAGDGARVEVGGDSLLVDGLFVATTITQATPFAEQLGLRRYESGAVEVDAFGHTSRAGVYAAGDLAHQPAYPMPLQSVLHAAGAGALAAMAAIQDVLATELTPAARLGA
jgi:thioredoxin reductase